MSIKLHANDCYNYLYVLWILYLYIDNDFILIMQYKALVIFIRNQIMSLLQWCTCILRKSKLVAKDHNNVLIIVTV